MRTMTLQAGFTIPGLIIFLIFGGCIVLFGLKLAPAYIENATIQSVLDGLKEQASIDGPLSAGGIRNALNKRLNINRIDRFDNRDNVDLKIQDRKVLIKYEVRTHILGNIDVVTTFSNSTEL